MEGSGKNKSMTITQTALLELTDRWKARVATLNAEASEIRKKTERETAPHTPDELAENVFGLAAGYAAARNELIRLAGNQTPTP